MHMFKWIRVRQETYDWLTTLQIYLQFVRCKKMTYEDVIRELLESYLETHRDKIEGYLKARIQEHIGER